MSLKQEIETWVQALQHYDNNEFEEALRVFSNIADTSKILFNCGVIHATIGEHDRAVKCYQRAVNLDQYLAVAYFQEGVSNFLGGDFEEALANFNDALLYLRGNTFIDYDQLGLRFKLYSCEVLFNRGLCYIYLQQDIPGMQDLQFAVKEKQTKDHDVIDDAIKEKAQGYTVFSIPVGVVYRPNEAKVKNLKSKDYLGRARLVATANATNTSTGFQGADRRKEFELSLQGRDDRPAQNISYAATNLVQRNIGGRAREQSAPPAIRHPQRPLTPPSENEGLTRNTTTPKSNVIPRSASVRAPNLCTLTPLQIGDISNGSTRGTSGYNRNNTADVNGGPQLRSALEQTTEKPWEADVEGPKSMANRSASESRGQPSRRLFTERSSSSRTPVISSGTPRPLYGEQIRTSIPIPEDAEPFDDVYSMYSNKQTTSSRNSHRHHAQSQSSQFIHTLQPTQPVSTSQPLPPPKPHVPTEEELDIIEDSADDDVSQQYTSPRRNASHSRTRGFSQSRPPSMKKIRIKVHTPADIRYILLSAPTVDYDDFESRVRAKFGLRGQLHIASKDEEDGSGDMVRLCDQDDLDALVEGAVAVARRERTEMGRIEVWVREM